KMGKTVGGALWLDAEKCSPFDFYQYWRNVADADVEKCLKLLTFLPMDKIRELSSLEGAEINEAKKVLAFEVTKLIHGEEEAKKAEEASQALFAGGNDMTNVPTEVIKKEFIGGNLIDALVEVKIFPSKAEGKRIVKQGGLTINDEKVTDFMRVLTEEDLKDDGALIKRGKKKFYKLIAE
ncbi:tyrosine--tRNA ligase, partial [Clostridium sp. Ade.TY]|uniref:tyrosine--tRNA ligase n=1 Tax=Clostridium sp. Ade.TY TaxID=1391647 RepID=UPI0004A47851